MVSNYKKYRFISDLIKLIYVRFHTHISSDYNYMNENLTTCKDEVSKKDKLIVNPNINFLVRIK